CSSCFVVILRGRPISTLFPYTTLFRSRVLALGGNSNEGFSHDLVIEFKCSHGCLLTSFIAVEGEDDFSTGSVVGDQTAGYSNMRSEEHTSELQSRFDLVCRLLLEKKK